MHYKFQSKADGDLLMEQPVGDQLLRAIGREPSARGIIAAADIPAAIAALEAAVAADRPAPRAAARDDNDDDDAARGIGLRQRAWPLLEMLKRSQAERADVVWGV